jgi:tetratricopeptide (TPR) repeat protein
MTGHTGPLLKAEMKKAKRRSPAAAKARDLYYQALSLFPDFNRDANARARKLLERSITLDPNDAAAHALLAWTHWRDVWIGWGDDPVASRHGAVEAAEKAVALDGSNYRGYWALGAALRLGKDFDAAALQYDRAFTLNPYDPDMLADWGEFLRDRGDLDQAIEQLNRAIALNPHHPDWYLGVLSTAYAFAGDYETALRTTQQIAHPDSSDYAEIAVAYVNLDRLEDAKAEIKTLREIDPSYRISDFLEWPGWQNRDPQEVEAVAKALRQAGLPE